MVDWNLDGRVALVTGASGGLGAHIARILARHGAHVIVAARRIGALERVAETIKLAGGSCEGIALDVSDQSSIATSAHLLGRIDILINNAGTARGRSALDLSEHDWDTVIDTNLKGVFLMSQAVAQAMKLRGRGGSIVNVASILGFRQAGKVAAYAVSKAGVIQLTKTLALEWARHGIRVNALAPGYIETELNAEFCNSDAGKSMISRIPMRRLGRIEELDGPFLLLASDLSSFMTGSVMVVDGGHLVSTL